MARIGFHDWGVSEACQKSTGQAVKKGRLELSSMGESLFAGRIFFFLREVSALLLGPFTWLNQAHPGYREENQLIMDFNHTYKMLSQQYFD